MIEVVTHLKKHSNIASFSSWRFCFLVSYHIVDVHRLWEKRFFRIFKGKSNKGQMTGLKNALALGMAASQCSLCPVCCLHLRTISNTKSNDNDTQKHTTENHFKMCRELNDSVWRTESVRLETQQRHPTRRKASILSVVQLKHVFCFNRFRGQ